MKKIVNSNGKLFGKFNVIDVLVFVAILIFVFFSVFKVDFQERNIVLRGVDKSVGVDKVVEYTVKVKGIRQMSIDALNENLEELTEFDSDVVVGDVIDVQVSNAKQLITFSDGTMVNTDIHGRYDLDITLRAKGTEQKDCVSIKNGRWLFVGDEMSLYNEYVQFNGMITNITTLNNVEE